MTQSQSVLDGLVERPIGPTCKTTFHCQGCPALQTKDWEFHEENDGIDRGTDAKCTAMTPNKHIGSYWKSGDRAPEWCPVLSALKSLEAL